MSNFATLTYEDLFNFSDVQLDNKAKPNNSNIIDDIIENTNNDSDKNKELNELKQGLFHYQRLGMQKAFDKAKIGIASYLLEKKMNFKLYKEEIEIDQNGKWRKMFHIDKFGNETELELNGDKDIYWELGDLKEYEKPIPIDALKLLPNDFTEHGKIMTPVKREPVKLPDPILVYPVYYKNNIRSRLETTKDIEGFMGKRSEKLTNVKNQKRKTSYWIGVYRWI